jgi:methyl-CpG-binding domain protein 4
MIPMRDDLMVQEQIKSPWQHMVGVICLNLTNRKQVKRVLPRFFKKWPTPHKLLKASVTDIENEISELGMQKTRALKLYRMSEGFLNWDGRDAKDLYGIGEYGSDSYEIFFKKNYGIKPKDKELKKYLENIL